MATYMDINRVQYVVSQDIKAPLCKLYFCRYCLKLRSLKCVSHEVDSHYCSNCLENVTANEAQLKKNRCTGCFDCPTCGHHLSTRSVGVAPAMAPAVAPAGPSPPSRGEAAVGAASPPDVAASTPPRKAYYLACAFCRWTSRDVGIVDAATSSGNWPTQERPYSKEIAKLHEYYGLLAVRENAERERDKKKYSRRRSYIHLSESLIASSASIRRRSGRLTMDKISFKENEQLPMPPAPSGVAVDDVEPLSDDVYKTPLVLTNVTTIAQRHAQPDFQPVLVSGQFPIRRHLLVKRSQRCKECEHNLCKSEYNPSSIKFKIQLVALQHVPEIRIMSPPSLQFGKQTSVLLTIFNPLDSVAHVTLLPASAVDNGTVTAKVDLTGCELMLSARDDAAQFDSGSEQQDFHDDPGVVVFRKANKIGFMVKVTPESATGDVKVGFQMRYDYRNMTTALQSDATQPELSWLQHTVLLNLGGLSP